MNICRTPSSKPLPRGQCWWRPLPRPPCQCASQCWGEWHVPKVRGLWDMHCTENHELLVHPWQLLAVFLRCRAPSSRRWANHEECRVGSYGKKTAFTLPTYLQFQLVHTLLTGWCWYSQYVIENWGNYPHYLTHRKHFCAISRIILSSESNWKPWIIELIPSVNLEFEDMAHISRTKQFLEGLPLKEMALACPLPSLVPLHFSAPIYCVREKWIQARHLCSTKN